jgi:hypothetical protein
MGVGAVIVQPLWRTVLVAEAATLREVFQAEKALVERVERNGQRPDDARPIAERALLEVDRPRRAAAEMRANAGHEFAAAANRTANHD